MTDEFNVIVCHIGESLPLYSSVFRIMSLHCQALFYSISKTNNNIAIKILVAHSAIRDDDLIQTFGALYR